jgi:hypothetical protein
MSADGSTDGHDLESGRQHRRRELAGPCPDVDHDAGPWRPRYEPGHRSVRISGAEPLVPLTASGERSAEAPE